MSVDQIQIGPEDRPLGPISSESYPDEVALHEP